MLGKKDYENIIIKNDKYTEDTLIALGLVKKYIIENKLIIVGGMAIDLALRLKSQKLYDDETLPDYDFYSPEHHKDAYKIAEMLHKANMKNISVINANHVSTMRVRVNYTVVADVTYIPKNVFECIPTIVYRDLRIIHPHYQMIDQHKSLSSPYENAPREVIEHRWKKDMTRYDILYEYYPVLEKNIDESIKLTDEIKIQSITLRDQCISGFVGLLYWTNQAKKDGFKTNINIGELSQDSVGFVVRIPLDSHGISVYSNDIRSLYKSITTNNDIKKERWYNRFLDKLPHKVVLDNKWELLDSEGMYISATKIDIGIYIANLQNIMLYLLTNYILLQKIKGTERGDSFYKGYQLAYQIIKWASLEYKKNKKNKFMQYLPTANVYGDSDQSDSYINSKRIFLEKIGVNKSSKLQPSLVFPDTFIDGQVPKKLYEFNASKSHLFLFDGSEASEFISRIYVNNEN
jgi:hypothetical protein